MKTKAHFQSGFLVRRAVITLACVATGCSVLVGTVLAFFCAEPPMNTSQRMLTFADRVAYQYAIEDVYWRHRIWPKGRPDPKPSLDVIMSQAQLENKVEDYLRNSQALEDYWHQPITAEQLQAEMDRMAQHTKQPEVLHELFEALGNDPFVIAECLARPVLTERLVAHLAVVAGVAPAPVVVATPLGGVARNVPQARGYRERHGVQVPVTMAAGSANYTLPVISSPSGGCTDDTWTATSTTNAPSAREGHTAVWTGSEMIVWGGTTCCPPFYFNTGGRYTPSTDSWTATSTINAPEARAFHTAVWTGSEMIVWGGYNNNSFFLNSGGRYNPSTDSWTATSNTNAPSARDLHTAVWTGSEMIVWGGNGSLNTGGKYNPTTNSWTPTSLTNAPGGRSAHTAVWTGGEMIVWGGECCFPLRDLNTGGRYNPTTNSWTPTSFTNAPSARDFHTAVWDDLDNLMIVWGGSVSNTGGRYNPSTDSWTATSNTNAPSPRDLHTAVWTGTQMIVWGGRFAGDTGGRYTPSTDSWTATSTTGAPSGTIDHTAVWTDGKMIVWGGYDGSSGPDTDTGGRYCAQTGAPTITLSAAGRKVGGINTVRLTWSGATSANIDVYRNGVLIVTTANDGSYIDSTGDTGRARYTYQVCEAGSDICSNDATVTFRQ